VIESTLSPSSIQRNWPTFSLYTLVYTTSTLIMIAAAAAAAAFISFLLT
jgi:hypothetical protein